jgi:CBS domain-containing protein
MARTVYEIMNHELFTLRPNDSVDDALGYLLALGITAAPILDDFGRPAGMVSLRDLIGSTKAGPTAGSRMSSPVATVPELAPIVEAARLLATTGFHRLVVVDRNGCAIGMASAVDVLRGLTGIPAAHPAAFPHMDDRTGLAWTDDFPLELDHVEGAPDEAGILVLIQGGAGSTEQVVWAETAHNLRTRLIDVLSLPQAPRLAKVLALRGLRFRAAATADADVRQRALRAIFDRGGDWLRHPAH